jgi:ADP-ribosylglycohydrolase
MLWAAWADALGFISELTDQAGLSRRLDGRKLATPVAWTRRVGGRSGVEVALYPGCYSDDTQLRLATARAVSGNGFDVEAFAHVELPVWPAYALGGGVASKDAAVNLARPGVPWYGNFHDRWFEAGGNGAAMRIQPHVWAAPHPGAVGPHLTDVIVDAVTTHGHPRAIVGAVVHALALGAALEHGQVPSPVDWPALLDGAEQAVKLVDENQHLASFWRPSWEKRANASFAEAWRATVGECRDLLEPAARMVEAAQGGDGQLRGAYEALVLAFGLADKATRGSGTATVIAALALSAALPHRLHDAALLAARAVGTDTDTIATMAAATAAAAAPVPLPSPVLDEPYLLEQAHRLTAIAEGERTETFSYPDLLDWQAPRSQIDAVGVIDGRVALSGLGWLEAIPEAAPVEGKGASWQWMTADFGATFLVKIRPRPRALPEGNRPARRGLTATASRPAAETGQAVTDAAPTDLAANTLNEIIKARAEASPARGPEPVVTDLVVDDLLRWVAAGGYTDRRIGYALRRIAQIGTIEQAIAFTTNLREQVRKTDPGDPRGGPDLLELAQHDFERLIVQLFRAMGYTEMRWHGSPDGEVDATAVRVGAAGGPGELVLIQAKRTRHLVPANAVAAFGEAVRQRRAARGVLVTTGGVSNEARELARSLGYIDLVDGRELSGTLRRYLGPAAPLPQSETLF